MGEKLTRTIPLEDAFATGIRREEYYRDALRVREQVRNFSRSGLEFDIKIAQWFEPTTTDGKPLNIWTGLDLVVVVKDGDKQLVIQGWADDAEGEGLVINGEMLYNFLF